MNLEYVANLKCLFDLIFRVVFFVVVVFICTMVGLNMKRSGFIKLGKLKPL
jgi:hypothetical protein